MDTLVDPIQLIVRLTLAAYLLPSAIRKIFYRHDYLDAVSNYKILSPKASAIAGTALAAIELAVSIALLLGLAQALVGACLVGLLSLFNVSMLVNLRRGRMIECGCYGIGGTKTIGWGAVTRNLMLIGLAVLQITFSVSGVGGSNGQIDASMFSSLHSLLLILILVGFCLIFITLVEWSIEVRARAAILQGIRFDSLI